MRLLKIFAGMLAAAMFMLSAVSGLSYADNIIIADENVDPETGLHFELLEDGTYSVDSFENPYVGKLVIPSEFNGRKVSAVRQIWHSLNVTSIIISDGIKEIDNDAFFGCKNLKEVYIPKSVERLKFGDSFSWYGCDSLENVYVADDNEFFCSIDGVVYTKDKKTLMMYPSGKSDKSFTVPDFVTTLNEWSFFSCKNIESVFISEGVTELESMAFWLCDKLETIEIPASVVKCDSSIADCHGLKKVIVTEENPNYCSVDGVLFSKDMTQMFVYPEDKLDEEYSVPIGITSMSSIRNKNIKRLTIPEGVRNIDLTSSSDVVCYYFCSIEGNNLEILTLPKSLETFYGAITNCANAEIRFGGTIAEWKALYNEDSEDKESSSFRIICSDGVIENDNNRIIMKDPIAEENSDGSVDFTAGITEDVADEANKLPEDEVAEIKQVIENISISTPANAGFDTSVEFYVTPNVTVPADFGDRRMALDLTFKNSNGDEVQPKTPVTVRIPVPTRLENSSKIYVYHVGDDGNIEKIEAVIETIDNIRYVVFETSKFSTYVLTDAEIKGSSDTSGSTSSGTSTPTTSTPTTSEPTSSGTSDSNTSKPTTDDNTSSGSGETSNPTSSDNTSSTSTPTNGDVSQGVTSGENVPKAEIKTPDGTLAEAVLTAEELEHYKNGAALSVDLAVTAVEGSVSSSDRQLVEKTLSKFDYKLGRYLDLQLFKTIDEGNKTAVTETNAPITVSFEIPEALRAAGREYVMIRVHNGEADVLKDLDDGANTITIRTDKFSVYVLAYSESLASVDNSQNGVNNPYTGNTSTTTVYLTIGIISFIVFITLCLFTGKNGMTEAQKDRKFAKLIAWGKRGGRIRAAVALTVILLLLSFYYGIGMKTSEN